MEETKCTVKGYKELFEAKAVWEEILKAIVDNMDETLSDHNRIHQATSLRHYPSVGVIKTIVHNKGIHYGDIAKAIYGFTKTEDFTPLGHFKRIPSAANAQKMIDVVDLAILLYEAQAIKDSHAHWVANKLLLAMNGPDFEKDYSGDGDEPVLVWKPVKEEPVFPPGHNEFSGWVNPVKPPEPVVLRYGSRACSLCTLHISGNNCASCPLEVAGYNCNSSSRQHPTRMIGGINNVTDPMSPWEEFADDPSVETAVGMIDVLTTTEKLWMDKIKKQRGVVARIVNKVSYTKPVEVIDGCATVAEPVEIPMGCGVFVGKDPFAVNTGKSDTKTEPVKKYRAIADGTGYKKGDVFAPKKGRVEGEMEDGSYITWATLYCRPFNSRVIFSEEILINSKDFELMPTHWEPMIGELYYVIDHYPPRVVTFTRFDDLTWTKHKKAMDYFEDKTYAQAVCAEIQDMDRQLRTPTHRALYVKYMDKIIEDRSKIDRELDE